MNKRIDIIGAGIGGLTLAVALHQRGLAVRVYEGAAAIRPVGAGINLACNAMQVYEKLGLAEAISMAGCSCAEMRITDPQFRSLSTVDIRPFAQRYGVGNVAIHRAALLDILVKALPAEALVLGKHLDCVEQPERPLLCFRDGGKEQAHRVVGADGLRSRVRESCFPGASVRTTSQYCWRGVVPYDLPANLRGGLTEAWGRGRRFGLVAINSREVYWFAVKDHDRKDEELSVMALASHFQDFAPLVQALITGTPAAAIHGTMLYDLAPLASWSTAQITLLGDAAHATTPNLGQGAGQAIEDADVLAQLLVRMPFGEAASRYEGIRRKKARQIVKTSRALGQLAHWSHPWAVAARSAILRLTPASVGQRQSAAIYRLARL